MAKIKYYLSIMDCNKAYWNLVQSRQKMPRKKGGNEYYERHHILPKSLGGPDKRFNIVLLTPREHYVAHLLLMFCFSDENARISMVRAFHIMCRRDRLNKNSRLYQYAREEFCKIVKRPKSEATKQKMKVARSKWKMTSEMAHKIADARRRNGTYKDAAKHLVEYSKKMIGSKKDPIVVKKWIDIRKERGNFGITEKCRIANIAAKKGKPSPLRGRKYENGFPKLYKEISQFTRDGIWMRDFKSLKEAAAETGANASNLPACCKGKLKTVSGFIWRYKEFNKTTQTLP